VKVDKNDRSPVGHPGFIVGRVMKKKGICRNSLIPQIIKENKSKVFVKVFHDLECFNKRAY
jgi:hypothetical protein